MGFREYQPCWHSLNNDSMYIYSIMELAIPYKRRQYICQVLLCVVFQSDHWARASSSLFRIGSDLCHARICMDTLIWAGVLDTPTGQGTIRTRPCGVLLLYTSYQLQMPNKCDNTRCKACFCIHRGLGIWSIYTEDLAMQGYAAIILYTMGYWHVYCACDYSRHKS